MKAVLASNLTLPWSASLADEKRFRLIVAICIVLALAISFTVPFITLPEPDRIQVEKIPPRLAKLLLEKKKIEPPKVTAPKPAKPEKPKLEEKKPKTEKKPEPKPKAEAKPKVETKPKPPVKPKRDITEIRKKVSNTGVLAMQDMLADLREIQPTAALKTTKPLQTTGTTERAKAPSVLLAKASKGSGGIDTSKLSRSASDSELAGRELTTVTSEIEAIEVATAAESDSRGRSEASIKKVLRANYNAIYTAYQRELRRNPLLKGKVLFRIVIEPDGSVSECTVIDSELGQPKLERKLALRIKRINFGAEDVETTTIDFPIAFLPG